VVVQPQAVADPDGESRAALRAELAMASALVRNETFPAVPGDHCKDCAFVPICPVKSAGAVIA